MHFYLPIAEMSANVLLFFSMGTAIGFVSGMVGVGGGFLTTPFLIFFGIPSAVAVGTGAAPVVASSVSGAMAQWRRNNVDLKMGTVLLSGGILGAILGVQVVKWLNRIGQFDFFVSVCYVTFLGVIGALMLLESLNTLRKVKAGEIKKRSSEHHYWIHRMPLKMRFHRSKLYISAIPPFAIGAFVGFLSGIMGVGGGFILVPAMIYLLRMPTAVAVGTSLFQIVFVASATTILHASENKSVDIVLALLLMVGGVIGAQLGAIVGQKLNGAQLRLALAALVLLVCLRMAWGLVIQPSELYSLAIITGKH
jgi:uncharacterized protein